MKHMGLLNPLLVAIVWFAGGVTGCSDEVPTASALDNEPAIGDLSDVGHRRPDGLVSLDVGDTWSYEGTFRTMMESGSEDWVVDREEAHTVVGTEERFGREYKVVEVVIREHGPFGDDEFTQWFRRRQDHGGLYGADVSVVEPPAGSSAAALAAVARKVAWQPAGIEEARRPAFARAWRELLDRREMVTRMLAEATVPAGRTTASAAENEFTILDYPLYRGASWQIRTEPNFTAYVERIELVPTELGRVLAWRIRVDNDALGPDDIVHVWYGPVGFVAQAYHLETDATDEDGNVIGKLIGEDELFLVSSSVMSPRGNPHAGKDAGPLSPRPLR